jgi:Tol biopolymer transport system component
VEYHPGIGFALFSVSNEGTLVINEQSGQRAVGWIDRLGRPLGLVTTNIVGGVGRLSRDATRIVASITDPAVGTADIYVIDLGTGARTRITSDPQWDETPAWSPDRKSVIYRRPVAGKNTLFTRAAEGTAPERRLITADDGGDLLVCDWSLDGRSVLVEKVLSGASIDLMLLHMPEGNRLEPWLTTTFNEFSARLSPDGRWVAYVSDESGADEVYVRAFTNGGAGHRITTNGGVYPVWSRDGKEMFAVDRNGMMVSVPVTSTTTVSAGTPRVLFDVKALGIRDSGFDVDAQGRFLMNYVEPSAASSRAEILLNWVQAIRK